MVIVRQQDTDNLMWHAPILSLLLQKKSSDNSIAHIWLDRDCFCLLHFQMLASKTLVLSCVLREIPTQLYIYLSDKPSIIT